MNLQTINLPLYVFAFVFNKHVMKTRYTENANGYDVAATGPESH